MSKKEELTETVNDMVISLKAAAEQLLLKEDLGQPERDLAKGILSSCNLYLDETSNSLFITSN